MVYNIVLGVAAREGRCTCSSSAVEFSGIANIGLLASVSQRLQAIFRRNHQQHVSSIKTIFRPSTY